jgi:peptide/nickel transport system substrate-binding protein
MRTRLSRRQLLGGIGAGTVTGLAGCADPSENASEEINGNAGEYTIVPYMDPTDDTGRWGEISPYWTRVVEPLVWGTDDMQPKPWLATDWEATDETTWVFELREGVTFHNDEEMTADDVVYSFEEDILTEYGDFVYGWLHLEPDSVEKIDEYTVEFTNTEPFAGFPGTIAHNMIDIHPRNAGRYDGNVVGTGPFMLSEAEEGQQVVVERFDDYWGGEVTPESLTFRAAEDVTTRTNLLESGDADIILDPAKSQVSSLEEDSSIRLETQQSSGSNFVSINIYNEPTDDATLRRALNYAISQEEIVDSVLDGIGTPARGPVPTVIDWAVDDELPAYEKETDRARELVDDSEYDGESLSVLVGNDIDDGDLITQIMQEDFDEIGVDVEIEVLERASLNDRTDRGEFHLEVGGSQSNSPAADYIMWENFHSLGISNIDLHESDGTGLHNLGGEVDELIETGFQSRDPDETRKAYVEAQRRIMEEGVVIPLFYQEYVVAMDDSISEIDLHPIDRLLDWRTLER